MMSPSWLSLLLGATFLAFFALGWLVPLVVGIVRTAKGQRSPGLIIFGALWGCVGIFIGGLAVVGLMTFRNVRAHMDIKPFDASQAGDQVATLSVPFEGNAELRFVRKCGKETQTYTTKGENGALLVPVGEVTPIALTLITTDADGKTWSASTYFQGRRRKPLTLAAGESWKLQVGPPLEARVTLSGGSTSQQHLDLKMKGAAGNAFTIRRQGAASKAPSFEVVDEKGEVVWRGDFSYG